MENLKNRKNSKQQEIACIPRGRTIAERSWSALSLTSNIECAYILEEVVTTETNARSCNPIKEEAATP